MLCKFETKELYYATVSSPAEPFFFEWNMETGVPTRLEWIHGGVMWFLHHQPGQITEQVPGFNNWYDLNLWITTYGYENADPHLLRGKLALDSYRLPTGFTLGAVLEGTATAWLVADGDLTQIPG